MSKEKKPQTLDISKLVKKAQEAFKKDVHLAQQLSSGDSIIKPTKESDFIVWNSGPHWQALTGLMGIPYGRIVQIAGKPDSGKSTHAAVFMKEAQDQGAVVILWDSEKKFSRSRFEKMGGKPEEILAVNTSSILNGVRGVAFFVQAIKEMDPEKKILIVWDSVGASINSTEDEGDEENYSKQPGVNAKQISFAIKKINRLQNEYISKVSGDETIATLCVNQIYQNIGSVGYTEKGGQELYYLSSLIIQLSRKGDLTRTKQGDKYKYGIVSRGKIRKNHLSESDETIAELDIVVSADGIQLAKDVKSHSDIKGWDDTSGDED